MENLIEYDESTCIKKLETATNEELWDAFLEGQTDLFFESDLHWVASQVWWNSKKNVLEFGSGNGVYLSKLAHQFKEKNFLGIEKLLLSVEHANERFITKNLAFQKGDAEILAEQFINSVDIVMFRLILQHLDKPKQALENAWHYLQPNGYVLVIDSCDKAKKTSHPITAVDEALEHVAELQQTHGIGNRKITLQILKLLENPQSQLSQLFEVIHSNIDSEGKVLYENTCLKGEMSRKRYFNHNLLFLALVQRTYRIQVNIYKAYKELSEYLKDEEAWTILGMHYLVLKKK